MSSRALTKDIDNFFQNSPSLPIPVQLQESINQYLLHHNTYDANDSNTLSDQVYKIYNQYVLDNKSNQTAFLYVLIQLWPCILDKEIMLVWITAYSKPAFDAAGFPLELSHYSRLFIYSIINYEKFLEEKFQKYNFDTYLIDKIKSNSEYITAYLINSFLQGSVEPSEIDQSKTPSTEAATNLETAEPIAEPNSNESLERFRYRMFNLKTFLVYSFTQNIKSLSILNKYLLLHETTLRSLSLLLATLNDFLTENSNEYFVMATDSTFDNVFSKLEQFDVEQLKDVLISSDIFNTIIKTSSSDTSEPVLILSHLCLSVLIPLFVNVIDEEKLNELFICLTTIPKPKESEVDLSSSKTDNQQSTMGVPDDSTKDFDALEGIYNKLKRENSKLFTVLYGLYPINLLNHIRTSDNKEFLKKYQTFKVHPNFLYGISSEEELKDPVQWLEDKSFANVVTSIWKFEGADSNNINIQGLFKIHRKLYLNEVVDLRLFNNNEKAEDEKIEEEYHVKELGIATENSRNSSVIEVNSLNYYQRELLLLKNELEFSNFLNNLNKMNSRSFVVKEAPVTKDKKLESCYDELLHNFKETAKQFDILKAASSLNESKLIEQASNITVLNNELKERCDSLIDEKNQLIEKVNSLTASIGPLKQDLSNLENSKIDLMRELNGLNLKSTASPGMVSSVSEVDLSEYEKKIVDLELRVKQQEVEFNLLKSHYEDATRSPKHSTSISALSSGLSQQEPSSSQLIFSLNGKINDLNQKLLSFEKLIQDKNMTILNLSKTKPISIPNAKIEDDFSSFRGRGGIQRKKNKM